MRDIPVKSILMEPKKVKREYGFCGYNVCNVSSLKTEYLSFYLTVLLGLDKNLAHKRYIGVLLSYRQLLVWVLSLYGSTTAWMT